MEFLHKLWDETLAGPAPETGVGKLRKYDSFSASRSSPPVVEEMPIITRSITILKSNSNFKNLSIDPGSAPDSPASSTCTTPRTPFSPGTPSGELRKWTRRKSSADALQDSEPRSPTVYDWFSLFLFSYYNDIYAPCLSTTSHSLYISHTLILRP